MDASRKRTNGLMRIVHAVGDLLYTLGFTAEYCAMRVWRVLRDGFLLFEQIASVVLRWIGRHLAALAKRIWQDAKSPFVRFKRRQAQLQRARARAVKRAAAGDAQVRSYYGAGLKSTMGFFAYIAGVLAPVAAVLALVFIVRNVVGVEYALAVEVNGRVLGYVADQSVVDSAKGLLRDRIRLARDEQMSDWQMNPSYTIARAGSYTTAQQLVNEILRSGAEGADAPVDATGLFIDETVVAATLEGERLKQYLDNMLENAKDPAFPEAEVSFVRQVECDPESNDVYLPSSIEDYDALIERLNSNEVDEVRASADGQQTLAEIALAKGITLDELLARNPELGVDEEGNAVELDGDFVPLEGTDLLITRAQPFLQVQMSYRSMSVEPIPYTSSEVENTHLAKGVRRVKQAGVEGEREVWDDYYYVNGEEVNRVRIDELTKVLVEPVEEIVEVGTRENTPVIGAVPPGTYGGGGFIFPVPESPYSSRGISAGHKGLDINAPTGTALYAAQGGVVTVAGWYYNYGLCIIIDHGGITTLYGHQSALYVTPGQVVSQGQLIGLVGATGNASGSHCHFEVRVNGQLVDPVLYVGYPY